MRRVVETVFGLAVAGVALWLLLFIENRPSELFLAGMLVCAGFFISKSLVIELIEHLADYLPWKN